MRDRSLLASLVVLGALSAACSGSGGGGSGNGFQLVRISVLDGAETKVNQEIVFTFSDTVDFSTVSLNTINIATEDRTPATGTFTLRSGDQVGDQVVFQPNCPIQSNLSDAGLQAGGVTYEITVVGQSSSAINTVRSSSGEPLEVTQIRRFTTPASTLNEDVFLDTRPEAPPTPVLRDEGSQDSEATHVEIGGNPANSVFFELDEDQQVVLSDPQFEAEWNLYSDVATQIAFVVQFDQPVDPSADNLSTDLIRLEYRVGPAAGPNQWFPMDTRITLEANCTETGSRVRLEPIGVLPDTSAIRAVVKQGFRDLVLNGNAQDIDDFAEVPIKPVVFNSLVPQDALGDGLDEGFDFGGESARSRQDTQALFGSPMAEWDDGKLTAAFQFDGSGGPGGSFDWLIESSDDILVDTTRFQILGADGVTIQDVVGGVVNVRNLTIEEGATLTVQGPHPLRINATGDVFIRGLLDISGGNAQDVTELNSGNVTELGGKGNAGGGRGGSANDVVTNSTPRGGHGQGPQGLVNAGGQGGETAFTATAGVDARRPGGGGGGRFGPSVPTTGIGTGLNAQPGADGNSSASGAAGGIPNGGAAGIGVPENAFFGILPTVVAGEITSQTKGALSSLWGGYGGGGGGNADPSGSFPTPNWTPASDEKGGAGGGGAGGLHIRALGRIVFGGEGNIRANGGRGALGENTLNQNHVGGSGGSGSGGHVILETASFVDFTDGGTTTERREFITAIGGFQVKGPDVPGTGDDGLSWGGGGGPGVVQIHVPDTTLAPGTPPDDTDIFVPALAAGDIDVVTTPPALVMIPTFGSRSFARSDWISLGAADVNQNGIPSLVEFLFGGIETTGLNAGRILVDGPDNDTVQPLAALLEDDVEGSSTVSILPGGVSLEVSGVSLAPLMSGTNDLYLRTPALLTDSVLRMELAEDPGNELTTQDFTIAAAAYDEGGTGLGDESLTLTVADEGAGDLQDYFNAQNAAGTVHFQLIPRFFRVVTGGIPDRLPSTAYVKISFQAAADDGTGQPNEAAPLVDWTSDISEFNDPLLIGQLQFFRFEVEFNLDADDDGVSGETEPVQLDFLRIPFRF